MATFIDNTLKASSVFAFLLLMGCGSGGDPDVFSSSSVRSSSVSTSSSSSVVVTNPVTITGTASYDYVPSTKFNGLDFSATEIRPIRGAVVEAISTTGVVLAVSETDLSGHYSLIVSGNTVVRIQIKAQAEKAGVPSWNIRIEDNTNLNALYAMQGNLASSGMSNTIRNLHADSGRGVAFYTSDRVAAPFAILDSIYTALQKFLQADPDLQLPESIIRWSVNNNTADGNIEDGDIGTSYYDGTAVYVLGAEDVDTDEYDAQIIVHEWGHFIDDKLSRSESIGGSHTTGDRLDMRVAMSEGFATGFAALMLDDPNYSDSYGAGEQASVWFDISNSNVLNPGWYSEESIYSIIYNYGDFNSIYQVITHPTYKTAESFISIFTLADRFEALSSVADNADFVGLLNAQNINSTNQFGLGETNSGGVSGVLPLYKSIAANGSVVNVCSSSEQGKYNKIGIRQFFSVPISSTGNYTVSVQKNGGVNEETDPDIHIYYRGEYVNPLPGASTGISGDIDSETFSAALTAGQIYVLEVNDWNHVGGENYGTTCFDVTLNAN